MKIAKVIPFLLFGRGVGWLGWLEWSDFFHRLISHADLQYKVPYKISTQHLKAFGSYPILKCEIGRRRHQPITNYSLDGIYSDMDKKWLLSVVCKYKMNLCSKMDKHFCIYHVVIR